MGSGNTWTPIKDAPVKLDECPFCHGGQTVFLGNPKMPDMLTISHLPDKGVNCPARYEQRCESFKQGAEWWNDRSPKKPLDLPEPPDDSVARSMKISKTPPVAKG